MMKFLSALLVLAAPAAARITIETDENGERRVVAPSVPLNEFKQRVEEDRRKLIEVVGDSGSFNSLPSYSDAAMGYPMESNCHYIELVAFTQEILDFSDRNDDGTTLWFPVYYKESLKLAGTYTEEAIITHKDNGDELECVINSVYNFGYNEDSEIFSDSITQTSTCNSIHGAITGGTGDKYECASGHQAFYSDIASRHITALVLYVCQNPCYPK